MGVEFLDDAPSAIAYTRSKVAHEDDGTPNFELKFVSREAGRLLLGLKEVVEDFRVDAVNDLVGPRWLE